MSRASPATGDRSRQILCITPPAAHTRVSARRDTFHDRANDRDDRFGRAGHEPARAAPAHLRGVRRAGTGAIAAARERPRPEAALLPAHGGAPRPGRLGLLGSRTRGLAGPDL